MTRTTSFLACIALNCKVNAKYGGAMVMGIHFCFQLYKVNDVQQTQHRLLKTPLKVNNTVTSCTNQLSVIPTYLRTCSRATVQNAINTHINAEVLKVQYKITPNGHSMHARHEAAIAEHMCVVCITRCGNMRCLSHSNWNHSSSERGTSPQARLPACVVARGRLLGADACKACTLCSAGHSIEWYSRW